MTTISLSFDLSTLRRCTFEPPPPKPPTCGKCKIAGMRHITRSSNRNGNAGRPYYRCASCHNFLRFDDNRGNDPGNPVCHCGVPSRTQVACREKGRKVHYVCRQGECDFYNVCRSTSDGSVVTLEDDILVLLAGLTII
ncbi:hypothetical protein GGI35DRAFT_446788 [Trichoderma velutinum]